MPLTVHSTWRAPFWIAASEFATASPRSLWQCTLTTAESPSALTTWPISTPYSSGIAYPTVSGMLTVLAPAATTARETSIR